MNKASILNEYDQRKERNEKLLIIFEPLIRNILNNNRIVFQSTSSRLKTRKSLEDNFSGNKYKGKDVKNFNDIPDIIGCRVVFYSMLELEKFIQLIRDNFSKISFKNKIFDDGYKGYNITCTLGNERKSLAEYSKVADIVFEIQATTVFFHGWNELEHDLFYKDKKGVKRNFPLQFEDLKKISENLSKDLSKIQNAWEDIIHQYHRVADGKKVFTIAAFDECANLSDNNQIYTFISRLNAFTSENGSLPANLDVEIMLQKIVLIVKKSITNKVAPEKTVFGIWPGKTANDIIAELVKTFSYTFYKNAENTISTLTDIYLLNVERNKIEEWFKEIAEYKYSILHKQGYIVQVFFLDLIEQWIADNKYDLYDLIPPILNSVLGSDFTGSVQSDYKTITFQRGGLHADKNIKKIRNRAIEILMQLYQNVNDIDKKLKIIETLDNAMRTSIYGGTVDKIIKSNIRLIARFYCSIFGQSSMKSLAKMEESLLWAQKRFPDESLRDIKSFFDLLDSNDDYEIYKTLVGYDGRIRFKKGGQTIEESSIIRSKKIQEYSNDINDHNIANWKKRLIEIGEEADKYGLSEGYVYFSNLLECVGKNNHELAWQLINSKRFKGLKEYLIAGLILSKNQNQISQVNGWIINNIQNGKFLYAIVRSYHISSSYNKNNLKQVIEAISKKRNKNEKAMILWEVFRMMNFENKYKSLILRAIKVANDSGYYNWTSTYFESNKRKKNFFESLKKSEWRIIKETLINKNSIDYHDEQILEYLIANYPKDFVEIFENRIIKKSRRKYDRDYDAIPYRMHHLKKDEKKLLEKNSKAIIDGSFKWLNKEYAWYFGIFLRTIFPNKNQYLENRLNQIIDLNDKNEWIKSVLPYLRWNQGLEIEEYVKRTIIKLDKDDEIWNACKGYLLNTGGVSGNLDDSVIGNAYRAILKKIEGWKTGNSKLNEFKKICVKDLKFRIKQEDAEHERTIQGMKRKYPVKSDQE